MSRGRPIPKGEVRISRIIFILADLQQRKGGILRFKDIHEEFVRAGIVSNIKYRGNTRRILKKLIEMGYLEQPRRGEYRLKVAPRPFQVIELIREVQESYGDEMIYEWRAGGLFWTLAEGTIFGLPRNIDENPVYKLILEVLLVRLANIFDAIVELGKAAKTSKNVKTMPIPYTAVREFILNILPYVIGELSGIDGDGLHAEAILKLYKRLLEHIPKEINGQPILVDLIRGYVDTSEKLLKISRHNEELIESLEAENSWGARASEKIVVVMHPPRHLIDESETERELYESLKQLIKKGVSDAMLLEHMRVYDESVVEKVLKYLELGLMLNKERKKSLIRLYKLVRAGEALEGMVTHYLSPKEYTIWIESENSSFEDTIEISKHASEAEKNEEVVLSEIRKEFEETIRRGYTLEDMVKGIWLSNWPGMPRFILYYSDFSENIVDFVRKSVRETLEAIGINVPHNFDILIEEGYRLMKKLDKMLKQDTNKIVHSLKDAFNHVAKEGDVHE